MDKLIFGKNSLERVVGLEVLDDRAEAYIEAKDGTVSVEHIPNRYWILSHRPLDNKFIQLKGNLYYKYGVQFKNRSDFLNARRMWKNMDIYSIYNEKEALMVKDGLTFHKNMKHNEVSILSFDIETTTIQRDVNATVLLISNTYRSSTGVVERKLFAYDEYQNVGEMIKAWCDWVREKNPSYLTGHNIYSFDLPYLDFVAENFGVRLILGRDGSDIKFDTYESKKRKDGSQELHYHKVHCYGREIIDTMFLALNYDQATRKYESYGLKQIIKQEGLEAKDRVFYDAQQIRYNYKDPVEWQKIKDYCIFDADDALKLYDLMAPPFFYMTASIPKTFQAVVESATGSQINSVMMRAYLQDGHSLPKATMAEEYDGGISFGNPGIYRNVKKVDVASLYPSIMIQYEVYDKDKDPDGKFKSLVQTFTNERFKNKKLFKDSKDKYYDDLQAAYKIFINSCYGFLGAQGLLFNSPRNAAFITMKGREILQKALNWAESKGYIIVNADTDSISFAKKDFASYSKEEQLKDLAELNSLYPEKIRFEDDGFYLTLIVLAAKNYIMWDGNTMKIKGSSLKSSTKEAALKEFQQAVIKEILDNTNKYKEVYTRYVKEALNIKDIKRWAGKKTITDTVLNAKRTNEQKVLDIIQDTDYKEGDKIWTYFKPDESLGLIEHFDGQYHKDKMLEKVYKTSLVFENVLPVDDLFLNYKLKRNKKLLEELEKT